MKYTLFFALFVTAISVIRLTYVGLISKLKTTESKIEKVLIGFSFGFSIMFAVITLLAYLESQNLFFGTTKLFFE